jgi:hypothetical protein
VQQANDDAGEDVIALGASLTYELTICGAPEELPTAENDRRDLNALDPAGLVFVGDGSVVRQTCADARLLRSGSGLVAPVSFTADGVTFDGGSGLASLVGHGDLVLRDVAVTNFAGPVEPPSRFLAAVVASGQLDVVNTLIADNANVAGLSAGEDLHLTDSIVARNGGSVDLRAGGLWADGDIEVVRSRVEENSAADVSLHPTDWGDAGGIAGYGSVTITDSEILGNRGFAGGVGHVSGPVTVLGSRIDGNHGAIGGGIRANRLTMKNTTVNGNDAGFGAGIAGTGSILDSTIADNKAIGIPSAGTTGGAGGGLFIQHDTGMVRTTVTGNTGATGSALLVDFGGGDSTVTVTDSTVSGNLLSPAPPDPITGDPAEIWHGANTANGELKFERSVVGTQGTSTCSAGGIPVASGGYTFWVDGSCGAPPAWGDVVNGGDPLLGPLQDNGGVTETRLPVPGSPLRDRIAVSDVGCGGVDQRGIARPQGLGCDIGAVEAEVAPSGFVGVAPTRILDTRTAPVPAGWPSGQRLGANGSLELVVAGENGVPVDATAVVLNVTSTQAESGLAYVAAWPTGQLPPPTSALNLQPGANVANSVTVSPGVGGKVTLFTNAGATHLIVDVLGYYVPAGGHGFTSVTPTRVLDTRTGPVPSPRIVGQKLSGPGTVRLPVAGVGEVPSDASSVVVNITTTQASSLSAFVTAWPAGQARPDASNLNLQPAYNVSNLALVKVGTGGAINLYTNVGSTHLIVDVVGYFGLGSGDRFLPLNPARVFDSRDTTALTTTVRHAQVAGLMGVPAEATGVVLNATSAAASSAGGFLTVFAKGAPPPVPLTSNLNYRPPFNAPNQAMVRVGQDASVSLLNGHGTAHIILDANGYFVPAS